MKKRLNKKGFTLIELVIVIAVIAILAVVAVPVVGSIVNDANVSVDSSNLALYQSAIEMVKAKTGSYPSGSKDAVNNAVSTYTNVSTVTAPKQSGGVHYFYVASTGRITISVSAPTDSVQID